MSLKSERITPSRLALVGILVLGSIWVSEPPAHAERAVGWVIECPISHRRRDDPIVYPNQPGASHLHDFFGNRTTGASSTYESLTSPTSLTTCSLEEDTAAYWIPTLRYLGRRVRPNDFDFYYVNVTRPHSAVQPFPPDLRMLAGDPMATAPQGLPVVQWLCDDGEARTTPPRDCGRKDLVARIKFPDCWDGVQLDSPDHRSHMAYSSDVEGDAIHHNVCPGTHSVPVPKLIFRMQWPVRYGKRVRLSSGPHRTLHADFINSWQQDKLEELVQNCINAGVHCGRLNTP